ncbi:MAG: MarR family transcriptional regulator [Verrucomicrobiales bacterium]|jgi:DNA-binding MarR family transcriptional regulator|nr:MarR family transcriptional regulator [Verrucomicrobiales bacterium]
MSEIDNLASKMRGVIRQLSRRAHTMGNEYGPSRTEQAVLAWLDEKEEMTPSALATAEKVRPQSMGQTLDSLDRKHWIKRRPHEKDRRQVLISLSSAGRKVLQEKRESRQLWLVGKLTKLSEKDRKTLASAMDILDQMVQG